MTKLLFLNLLTLFAICAEPAKCQQAYNDKPAQADLLPDSFYTVFNNHLPLFNGRLFFGYPAGTAGHAFYPDKNWSPVTVRYDGIWYNTTALYDICSDDLIVLNPDSTSPFILYSERVSQFMIQEQTFIRLNETIDPLLKNGLYQVVSGGAFAVFIKRRKIIQEEIVDRQLNREFVSEDLFFIRKNNQYYRIRKKSDLYALIKEKKPEILKNIKSRNLKFKKNPEAVITLAAGFYK
jgi:hypothetical protein